MGFLDMFDNPDIMSSLLGINTAVGSPGAMPQAPAPQPPPQMTGGELGEVLDQAPPQYQDVGLMKRDQLPPGQPAGPTMAGVGFPPPPSGSAMAAPANPTPLPSPSVPNFGGGGYGGGSPDQERGPWHAGPGGGTIPTNVGPVPISTGPLNSVPAPPPPQGVAGPPTSTYGSLGAALGLKNPRVADAVMAGMAGLGHGLSAAGQLRPGATAGAAFGAGAGGALTGGIHQLDLQQAQRRQDKMDNFLMSSNAFKDWISARHADNEEELTKARAQYFGSRAQAAMTGSGSNAWQNTPYGKVISVENEVQKFEKSRQIVMMNRWTKNGSTKEEQQNDLDKLQKDSDAYRSRLYKQAGVDPDKAEKIRDMGTDKDNPFDTKGMTLQQFHDQVPMGAWFKDQNGVVRQRTVAPPGSSAGAAPTSTDDYLAATADLGQAA